MSIKTAVDLPSEEDKGKPSYDEDFKAGFAAGKAAIAKDDSISKVDADKAFKKVQSKHGSWWVDGYTAAIDLARGAYATKGAQIAKKMKLASQALFANSADMRAGAKLARHRPDPTKMDPEAAMEMADAISNEVARQAKDSMDMAHGDIRDAQERLADINRAWGKWDWEELERLGLLSHEDAAFVREVTAMYSW